MSYLTVVVFDDPEEAGKVRQSLKSIEKQGLLSLDDSAIIVKDEDGQVHVKNEVDRGVKVGLAGGGLVGLFIGFLFGGPIGAMLLGALPHSFGFQNSLALDLVFFLGLLVYSSQNAES